ncbi:MAG: ABC transporter permease [Deltaproteobacteria bacterium]|nr:ABC transporter permease [Deltaproteobacteria bacterium]MBW1961696.1 ABC transporter permease [Deltaproteobacteria bacterium]MBW1993467.1 ABC transporter permease [Deltaproteobacteria bacterium]MBW2151014.1 ABC transporter permease [Deltaproteobacteria bacterium]
MWVRIGGLLLRNLYLYRRSLARVMEILFWPVMNLMVWGFLTHYLKRMDLPVAIDYLLGAMILWDLLYRSQQSITLSLTEEFWVKNVMNLFIAPIRTFELVFAMCIMGISKSLITTAFLGILAFLLYHFNILKMGLFLIPFFGNLLLFGWALGMMTMSIILRFGHAAEALIWGVPFLIQPISAVFYPVEVLPSWLKVIAFMLPSTYVFEGMRAVFNTGQMDISLLLASSVINLAYIVAGAGIFSWTLRLVRKRGLLSRTHIE